MIEDFGISEKEEDALVEFPEKNIYWNKARTSDRIIAKNSIRNKGPSAQNLREFI